MTRDVRPQRATIDLQTVRGPNLELSPSFYALPARNLQLKPSKRAVDMGQEGAEGTDCPAEKYTACDGCMTTCAGQMVCGGTGDDGKKPSGDDRK